MKKLLFAAAMLCSTAALAIPSIQGTIAFSGTFTDNVNDGTGTGTLDFANVSQYAVARDGDFPTALAGDFLPGSIQFGPVSVVGGVVQVPIDTLWSLAGASFVMDTVSLYSNDASGVALDGGGILSLAGFADTRGLFSMDTANSAFTFDADTTNADAPGMAALLSLGLIGLVLQRRSRK